MLVVFDCIFRPAGACFETAFSTTKTSPVGAKQRQTFEEVVWRRAEAPPPPRVS